MTVAELRKKLEFAHPDDRIGWLEMGHFIEVEKAQEVTKPSGEKIVLLTASLPSRRKRT